MDQQEIIKLFFQEALHDYPVNLPQILQGLSKGEIGVLGYLTFVENRVSAGLLASHLHVTSARIASILKSLEKKNYIIREKSEIDKRKVVVTITDQGNHLICQLVDDMSRKLNHIISVIGVEDALTYLEITRRIKEALYTLERSSIC